MKLTLKTYTKPLVIEVEKDGEVIKTLEFELDFCDTNVFKMTDMAKEVVNYVKDFESLKSTEDTLKAAKKTVAKIKPMIDMFAGECATEQIAAAFGEAYKPEDCLRGIIEVWSQLNEECIKLSASPRVANADKYLDEEA